MSYNGWKNYETWNVALWIDNDQSMHLMRMEWTREAYANANPSETSVFTKMEQAVIDLSEVLKDWIEENNPLAGAASMYADLLGAAISEVDFAEIAINWLEDIDTGDKA